MCVPYCYYCFTYNNFRNEIPTGRARPYGYHTEHSHAEIMISKKKKKVSEKIP